MTIVDQTIEHDEYLPARRAAAFLLGEILNGSQSLIDQQDILLPIYRKLKDIAEKDADHQMRIHARNGLLLLKEKVLNAFSASQNLQKEIKVMGVKLENNIKFK